MFQSIRRTLAHVAIVAAVLVPLAACNFEFPLTATPTRTIEPKLLGEWTSTNNDETVTMKVVKLDAHTYIVSVDDDIYRAFHSDFEHTPFLSVQDLGTKNRLYAYANWSLSADGNALTVRFVNHDVVAASLPNRATVQRTMTAHLKDDALFGKATVFTRKVE